MTKCIRISGTSHTLLCPPCRQETASPLCTPSPRRYSVSCIAWRSATASRRPTGAWREQWPTAWPWGVTRTPSPAWRGPSPGPTTAWTPSPTLGDAAAKGRKTPIGAPSTCTSFTTDRHQRETRAHGAALTISRTPARILRARSRFLGLISLILTYTHLFCIYLLSLSCFSLGHFHSLAVSLLLVGKTINLPGSQAACNLRRTELLPFLESKPIL